MMERVYAGMPNIASCILFCSFLFEFFLARFFCFFIFSASIYTRNAARISLVPCMTAHFPSQFLDGELWYLYVWKEVRSSDVERRRS